MNQNGQLNQNANLNERAKLDQLVTAMGIHATDCLCKTPCRAYKTLPDTDRDWQHLQWCEIAEAAVPSCWAFFPQYRMVEFKGIGDCRVRMQFIGIECHCHIVHISCVYHIPNTISDSRCFYHPSQLNVPKHNPRSLVLSRHLLPGGELQLRLQRRNCEESAG